MREKAQAGAFGRNEARLSETAEPAAPRAAAPKFMSRRARPRGHARGGREGAGSGATRRRRRQRWRLQRPRADQPLEFDEAVRATFAVNLFGQLNTIEPAIPSLVAHRWGLVAFVGSMMGLRAMHFLAGTYCATKAALHSYATSLRAKLSLYGVDVSLIVPGWVDTPMSQRTTAWKASMITDAEAAEIVFRGLENAARSSPFRAICIGRCESLLSCCRRASSISSFCVSPRMCRKRSRKRPPDALGARDRAMGRRQYLDGVFPVAAALNSRGAGAALDRRAPGDAQGPAPLSPSRFP